MSLRKLICSCILLFLSVLSFNALAQGAQKKLQERLDNPAMTALDFPNINKIKYYEDKKKKEQLRKFDREKNWEKLYPLLKDYVLNFGIQNFYKETFYLWRLAKLTEVFGSQDEAKMWYRMALRHHHEGIDLREIELYYDSLNNQQKSYYVPLDYYYELVEYRKNIDTIRPPRGVMLNMGPNINSNFADYGPALNANDQVMIFTSRRNEIKKGINRSSNEDLFYSDKKSGYWKDSKALREINTEYNEGSACLSKDGKTLYFSRCDSPDSYGNCDIFVSYMKEDSTWSTAQNLGSKVNSIAWDSHPSLSHTEDTLFFASDRIGGFGLSDIYYAVKDKKGEWQKAQNAGPVINSRNNDVNPFFHPKHPVIYFSSNGHLLNFGEFDIFKSNLVDGKWEEPQNIGPLMNTEFSEFYFTIDSDSRQLYYARSSGSDLTKLDLFSFPLPMEGQPEAVTKVYGSLTDEDTGLPFKRGIVSIIDMDQGIEVAPQFLRPDGTFEFNLINNSNYLITIQGNEFFRIEEMFYLEGDTLIDATAQALASRVKFESIEFDPNKADLKPEMYGDLNKIVNFMYDNPEFQIRISGHTDSTGDEQRNVELSRARAQAIRDFLVIFGSVENERVEFEGYGSAKPLVEEKTAEDRKLNRRVEFEIFRPAKEEEKE